ncbi:DUF5979 domain-containing protein [Leucobacter sp.]
MLLRFTRLLPARARRAGAGNAEPTLTNTVRRAPALGTVLALAGMMLVPVSAANAAPGDLAHGVVSVDANKNGALDASGAPGDIDRGLAGVVVNALDAGGTVVGTTTTAADGSWSIKEADVSGTAVKIEIVTSDANGNVYATHPAASGDNAFTRAGGLDRAAADLTGTDVTLNALVYPVWKLDAKLADDPDGVGGKSILTGTPTFDANDSDPGNDSSTANTRVRSSDIVAFNWSLTTESEDGSLGGAFTDAVFEQTITLQNGAIANFASIPAVCDQAKSRIVALPSGTAIAAKTTPPAGTTSLTLSCVLGEMGVAPAPSAYILSTQVQPSSLSPNGSSFETASRFYAVDGNGAATAQPDAGPEVPPIEVTAAPRYDVEKLPANWSPASVVVDGEVTTGIRYWYTVQISTDRKSGVEAFQQPITLEESFWGTRSVAGPGGEAAGSGVSGLKWYLDRCEPSMGPNGGQPANGLVYSRPGVVAAATQTNSVANSGNCSIARTGAADTGNYTLTLNGIDASGRNYPTQTAAGQSLAAGPFYVASYRIGVFIPSSEIDRLVGAPDDGVGEISVSNRVGDFDPLGISGASNYGSGTEPGYCEPGPTNDGSTNCEAMEDGRTSNNVAGPVTIRIAPGSWAKYILNFGRPWHGNEALLPGMGGSHDGAAQVQPGQAFTSSIRLNNTGNPMTSAEMCDVFDSTVLKLAPLAKTSTLPTLDGGPGYAADQYSVMLARYGDSWTLTPDEQRARQSDWIVQYGRVDLTGDDPNTGVFDLTTNRYEGDWTRQRQATNGANTVCGSPDIEWSDTPSDDTNVVWIKSADGYVIRSGELNYWLLAFEQRDTYAGGPHDGEAIPSGTVAANYGNVKSSTYLPNWNTASYVPGAGGTSGAHQAGESGSLQGDRWTVTRATMKLQKRTIASDVLGQSSSGVADYGVTGAAMAGKPVVWEITATLTANSNPATPVNNVVVTDTLPKFVAYNEAATQAIEGGTAPTSVTANPDGTTTLVWNLGTRTPNEDLPVLRVATTTDSMAPPNTTAVNWAAIAADGIVPVSAHKDDHTIRIEQSGQVQLKKSVDRTLDLQNDDQQYTLQVKNFSETLAIQPPTIYDVLPYNGDATNAANVNRTPSSDYSGTSRLHEAPKAFDFDATTARSGTFHYTTVPGAQVPQRQQDDTDPSIWSTTFTPNATGFKFVADSPLTTTADADKSGIVITFRTDQAGNDPGDIYTNRFTAISKTLNNGDQLLTSDTVSVRVAGFSLGDLIWYDLNGDGEYTAGTDRPAPEGVTVQVRNAAGSVVATTTTLGGEQQGRWVVNDLSAGDYYVTIPAGEFAADGKLGGAIPAPAPVSDPNTDVNEDGDHHAIADGAGVRSSGVITLSADTDTDPIAGEEPLIDNVAGLTLTPLTADDFTNLTLDLALTPAAKFTVAKVIDGAGAQYHADTEFDLEVTCTLGGSTVRGYPRTVTLKGGESSELSAPAGANCTAVETDDGGATEVSIDPEGGVRLDFEPENPITITATNTFEMTDFVVAKTVEGNGAHLHADTEFAITVDCRIDGTSWGAGGYPQDITLRGGESETFTAPVGANCTATETDAAGATEVSVDPADGVLLTGEEDAAFAITVVNTFEVGSFRILKELDGAGVGLKDAYEFGFTAVCTYRDAEVLNENVTLTGDGTAAIESGQFDDLPVGAECTITETANGGADETPAPVQITIDRDPETVQIAGFVNEYSAGTIEVVKTLEGAAAEHAFVKDLPFEVAVTCQVDVDGRIVDVYSGVLRVKGGETVSPEIDGEPVLIPFGARCFGEETNAQGASRATVDHDGYDNAAIVTKGDVDTPQKLTLTAVNTFDQASLTVSKKVVGPDTGESYSFELACTYPVAGEDGTVTRTAYPLADDDAKFTLKHGESRTVEVLKGVDCGVVETDAPAGAVVTYLDSDGTTLGGDTDGEVSDLVGDGNTIEVTNALELAKLTVSKTVSGPGPEGAEYRFELDCTYHGTDGDVPFPLEPADAEFALKHGESRTIEVLAGVTCKVAETDVPRGATVTIVDTDDRTDGGAEDGVIADLHGDGNTVEVTNTFRKLSTTGGAPLTGAIAATSVLLLAGAALLVARRRRKEHTPGE